MGFRGGFRLVEDQAKHMLAMNHKISCTLTLTSRLPCWSIPSAKRVSIILLPLTVGRQAKKHTSSRSLNSLSSNFCQAKLQPSQSSA